MLKYVQVIKMSEYFSYKDDDFFAHYVMNPKPDPREFQMHTHEHYELFYFISGKGKYRVEGNEYNLMCGDIAIMRPNEAHHIEINPNYPYTRFTIHFTPELFKHIDPERKLMLPFDSREAGKMNIYRADDFKNTHYKAYLKIFLEHSDDRRLQLLTNLLPLLNELLDSFKTKKSDDTVATLDFKIVRYVNQNITQSLSLDKICEEFYISKAQLCRLFKRATGSTVWEYISVKRLALARELLKQGTPTAAVCVTCGFKDYSVFYRAYKKKYGIAPSDDTGR